VEYSNIEGLPPELDEELYARHAEIKNLQDLEFQRGTSIPALFNLFYKFIQNPSTVSVDTFKRMVDTDDTIGSAVDLMITMLASRLGTYQHPSPEITKWVNAALNEVQGGFYNAIKELLYACASGFMVSEKNWANTDMGFIVDKIVPLPPQTVLFEVDRTGELTPDGILQYQRNYNPALLGAGGYFGTGFTGANFGAFGMPDPYSRLGDLAYPIRVANVFQYLSIRIPKQKCIHYAFNSAGQFKNPYGRSPLRRAYKHWVMKDAVLRMLSTALDRKGTPIIVLFADPNKTVLNQAQFNAHGGPNNPTPNFKGQQFGKRADQAALDAFKNIHQDSIIVLPGKKDEMYSIDPVQVQSNAGEFIAALKFFNESMMRSMGIPSLIMTQGDGSGAYALGQEHSKTMDKILDGYLIGFKNVLIDQYVKDLIQYNFPESAWKKDGLGEFSKREVSQEELDKIIDGYDKLQTMGAISMADLQDLNKVRETSGFSEKGEIFPAQPEVDPSAESPGNDVIGPESTGEVDEPIADKGDVREDPPVDDVPPKAP
jgi:hypothetical protein